MVSLSLVEEAVEGTNGMAALLYQSMDRTAKAFRAVDKMSKANGQTKKSL